MSFATLLMHPVTVYRQTMAPDGKGGFTETWKETADYFARIAPASANTRVQYSKLGVSISHTVFALPSADIREGDRIHYGSRVFKVNGVTNPHEMNHHLEISCEEVK